MENRSVNSQCDVLGKFDSKNLQIRLLGHCIICLRKVSLNLKGNCGTSDGDSFREPEIAPKSVVTTPGFLTTFNQVWAVLQTKWKENNSTNRDGNGSSEQIGISLENVLPNGWGSTNVSFSRAPTICQLCCDKILAVENLMKAVRQQVREISMVLVEGRRRQDGRLCDFETSLREKGLEESVVKATLQFVGVLELEPINSQDNFKELEGDQGCAEANTVTGIVDDLECDEDNSLGNSQIISDEDNEGQTGELGDQDDEVDSDYVLEGELEEDDEDPDYIKSEPEEDDDEDESEEGMDVDEEDKNDPDYEFDTDPLAVIPPKKRKKDNPSFPANQENNDQGSNVDSCSKFPCSCGKTFATFLKLRDHQRKSPKKHPEYKPFSYRESNEDNNKIRCTCGKMFGKMKTLREHMRKNKNIHPEYEPFKGTVLGNRQVCELCGQRVMHNDMLGHLKEAHLNGQAEWVIKCPNEKCPYMFVSSKEFHLHLHRFNTKDCKKIWKEKWGHVCETCGFKGTNLLKIRNHVKEKHENREEKKWTCPISGCGKMFCVKQAVHFHLHEHRNRRITQQNCDKCGEGVEIGSVEGHLKDKHGIEEVIGCKQCPFKFSGREQFVEHLFEHRDVGFLCDICGDKQDKFVGRYSEFREHYFGVHKFCPKKYKCEEKDCDMWFWRKETQESHVLRMHRESSWSIRYRKSLVGERGKGKKEFECDVCDDKFVTESGLESHKIRIHGADPFKCDICGVSFDKRDKFTKHKKEHMGIVIQKEWKCEVEGCGKTFKQKNLWKRHKEVGHGGEKRHVCEICGKSYCDASGLRDHHKIVHLGLRPWVCDECGERFSNGTTLKRHKMIHTGERPFGCEICGQRFRHKEVLKTHLKGHEKKGADFKPNGPMKQIRKRKAQ